MSSSLPLISITTMRIFQQKKEGFRDTRFDCVNAALKRSYLGSDDRNRLDFNIKIVNLDRYSCCST